MTTPHDLIAAFAGSTLVDLTPTIRTNMPRWPTHPDVMVVPDARTHEQHGYFAQTLILPEHSGCHVDAPAHLREGDSTTVDRFPLDALIGPAKKFDLSGEGLAPGTVLTTERFRQLTEARNLQVERGDIVLFEFGWDEHYAREEAGDPDWRGWWGANAPGLDEGVCRSLYDAGVRAVGSDTAGCDIAVVDGVITSSPGHHVWFLPKGIPVIEGLGNLAAVPAEFFFIALPLRIASGSGSPIRAVGVLPTELGPPRDRLHH